MSAAMELHVALSLRLDATEAYRLAHAYRDEVLAEHRAQFTMADARGIAASHRAAVLDDAAEVAHRAARACGDDEVGQYAASVAAGIGRELRRMAAEAREKSSPAGVDATPDNATVARRAHLLNAINQGGRWKSGTVTRWYQDNGYTGLDVHTARRDLAVLRESGAIVQHDEKGVRYFTAARAGGSRG